MAWTLNGASTQAYRVGIVGNTSEPPPPEPTTSTASSAAAGPTAVQGNVQNGASSTAPALGAVLVALGGFALLL